MIKINNLVTKKITKDASNIFIVKDLLKHEDGKTFAVLYHPMATDYYLIDDVSNLDLAAPIIKDSSERGIDFLIKNKQYLSYNSVKDLEALCVVYALKRELTTSLKSILATLCGYVAKIKFKNDLNSAMKFVKANEGLLDEFNSLWYNNFKGLFSGHQAITSSKQRHSIFNIAGFLLAELENPTTVIRDQND